MATLQDWRNYGWLQDHQSSRQEIAALFAVADRDIEACQTPGLHADWVFNIAYNAALQLSAIALYASGFKPERSNHHFRIIQSLELTVGSKAALIRTFDAFRKKRNLSDYERADLVSESEVAEMLTLARNLRTTIAKWLKTNHPDLAE